MPSTARKPTIVVGYDGSDAARAALVFAARQAGPRGRVLVVHAFELAPDLRADPDRDLLISRPRTYRWVKGRLPGPRMRSS